MSVGTAILAVVRRFGTPLSITKLVELGRSLAASGAHHVKIQRLAEEVDQIKSMVDDAANMGIVDNLLWLLSDVIHDAEELVDIFRYESANATQILKKCCLVANIGTNISLNRLKKLLGDLPSIRWSLQELHVLSQHRIISRPITQPRPAKEKLFGYSKEYTTLLSSLLPDNLAELCGTSSGGGDIQVIAVIGRGGTGKTELVRSVFNHSEKVQANFDLLMWVCVYGMFTEADLLNAIWKSVAGADAVGEMNVTGLQRELTKKVKSAKRYLLVLDDVCNDELAGCELSKIKTWGRVLAPFRHHGGRGGRIVITTRAKICSEILNAGISIVLNGINTDESKLLLKKTAFGDEHTDVPRDLEDVLKNNVSKLHGSPLAAEEVGCILKDNHDSTYWREILSQDDHKTHLSSYHDLSPHLKRCFAFCSIFPRKWEFEPEKLVRMWIAHGFVEVSVGPDRSAREENKGKDYFDALLQRSLFEESEKEKDRYVIHEEIHSMLRQVAAHYYLSIDGPIAAKKIPITARHLSVSTDCVHQLQAYPAGWLRKLRTLLVYNQDKIDNVSSASQASIGAIDRKVLKKFKRVRVLDFSDTSITELPEFISDLTNVRYLGLPNTIKELGAHVTKLQLLQTLSVVSRNGMLRKVPCGISKLSNLRHLDIDVEYIAQIAGTGSMEKMHVSIGFHAGRRAKAQDMGQLEKLNSLSRTLSIKGLENVRSKREAERAQLAEKEHLKVLMLEWQPKKSAILGSDVLNGLRPHPNLQELHITRYQGRTWPGWLTGATVLENLRSLYLRNCTQVQALPLVSELPYLEVLFVEGLHSVVSIDSAQFCCKDAPLRSLTTLVLKDMENLAAWDTSETAPGTDVTGTPILLPQLTKVEILHCPMLRSFSGLLYCRTSLAFLRVERCQELTATFTKRKFPMLTQKNLHIHDCPNLTKHFEV